MTDDETPGTLVPFGDDPLDGRGLAARTVGAFDVMQTLIDTEIDRRRKERAERLGGDPRTDSDIAPMVRDLMGMAETLAGFGQRFNTLAKHVSEAIEEELNELGKRRAVIADGEDGTEIVAKYGSSGTTEIRTDELADALAASYGHRLAASEGATMAEIAAANSAYRQAINDVVKMGSVSWRSTAVESEAKRLQEAGLDAIGSMFQRSVHRGQTDPKFTVKREEQKSRRRA